MEDETIKMICEKAKERARLIDDIECKAIESRLAELGYVKERTCKIKQAYFDSDEEIEELMDCIASTQEDTVVCICMSCGCNFRFDRGIKPSYCPFCGAKNIGMKQFIVSNY